METSRAMLVLAMSLTLVFSISKSQQQPPSISPIASPFHPFPPTADTPISISVSFPPSDAPTPSPSIETEEAADAPTQPSSKQSPRPFKASPPPSNGSPSPAPLPPPPSSGFVHGNCKAFMVAMFGTAAIAILA
ncbi:hypothetical protein PIB30_013002 [Stylosanthes scabra]|uniref:Uncharacterized protein n=1 Tax=Stylosanthes scabra TaxID=79078 RepID=A0ABU6R623_9FABA|nr:hypothetical protein [Stylosanthes scabra]